MVCTQVEVLPHTSVALQVRRIIPLPVQLVAPNASTKLMFVTPLQVSVAVAAPVMAGAGGTVHSMVIFAGQLIFGGTVSLKSIFCRQVELLPHPSVAVQVRRIIPLPVQLVAPNLSTKLMFVTPLHVSVAVATPVMAGTGGTVHSKVRFAGQVI